MGKREIIPLRKFLNDPPGKGNLSAPFALDRMDMGTRMGRRWPQYRDN